MNDAQPPLADECPHPNFAAQVKVGRLTDGGGVVRHFMAEISISCAACGLPFNFLGAPAGVSFVAPRTNVLGTELHAPLGPGERTDIPTRFTVELPGDPQ